MKWFAVLAAAAAIAIIVALVIGNGSTAHAPTGDPADTPQVRTGLWLATEIQ